MGGPFMAPPAPFHDLDDSCEFRWTPNGGPGGSVECYVHAGPCHFEVDGEVNRRG